jgi:hypothetical protein
VFGWAFGSAAKVTSRTNFSGGHSTPMAQAKGLRTPDAARGSLRFQEAVEDERGPGRKTLEVFL